MGHQEGKCYLVLFPVARREQAFRELGLYPASRMVKQATSRLGISKSVVYVKAIGDSVSYYHLDTKTFTGSQKLSALAFINCCKEDMHIGGMPHGYVDKIMSYNVMLKLFVGLLLLVNLGNTTILTNFKSFLTEVCMYVRIIIYAIGLATTEGCLTTYEINQMVEDFGVSCQ